MATKAKIDTPKNSYLEMSPRWEMIDTLIAGTQAMRDAGEKYLPKEELEKDATYQNRKSRSFLLEVLEPTIDNAVGRVFRKPIMIDNIPIEVEEWIKNIDNSGKSLGEFFRNVFKSSLSHGMTHVLVEFPDTENLLDQPISKLDEKVQNIRPYCRHIQAPDLIYWRTSKDSKGNEFLSEIRIKEVREEVVGYGDVVIDVIRIIRPNDYEVWEYQLDTFGKKNWVLVEIGTISLGYIPLVTVYSTSQGFMFTKPPFLGFAQKNIEHWQKNSDLSHIIHISCVPFLFYAGLSPEEIKEKINGGVGIGVGRSQFSENPDAKVAWVEHTGSSIKVAEENVDKIVDQMAALGVEILVKNPGVKTATASIIDQDTAVSKLTYMAMTFQENIREVLVIMGDWVKIKLDPKVTVNTDFSINEDVGFVTELYKSRELGQISQETYLDELQRRGILSDKFSYEVEKTRLNSETPENI